MTPDPIARSEFDSLSRQVASLASALEVASISSGQSRHIPDLLHHTDLHAREISSIKQALSGLSRDSISKLVRAEVAAAIAPHLNAQGKALAGATGRILKEEAEKRAEQVRAAVANVQNGAELARATAKATLEAAEATLNGFAYSLTAEKIPAFEKATTASVEALFKKQDAAFSKLKAAGVLHGGPPAETVGAIVAEMVNRKALPETDPDMLEIQFASELNRILRPIEKLRTQASRLSTVAGFIKGREPIDSDTPGYIVAAATALKLGASTGFPVAAVADKVEAKTLEALSNLRDFEIRMFERWRAGLKIAAKSGACSYYRAIGQSTLARKSEESARAMKADYRARYGHSTRTKK